MMRFSSLLVAVVSGVRLDEDGINDVVVDDRSPVVEQDLQEQVEHLNSVLATAQTAQESQEFDCDAGLENAATGWTEVKKQYCCKEHRIGCDLTSRVQDAGDQAVQAANNNGERPAKVVAAGAEAAHVEGVAEAEELGLPRRSAAPRVAYGSAKAAMKAGGSPAEVAEASYKSASRMGSELNKEEEAQASEPGASRQVATLLPGGTVPQGWAAGEAEYGEHQAAVAAVQGAQKDLSSTHQQVYDAATMAAANAVQQGGGSAGETVAAADNGARLVGGPKSVEQIAKEGAYKAASEVVKQQGRSDFQAKVAGDEAASATRLNSASPQDIMYGDAADAANAARTTAELSGKSAEEGDDEAARAAAGAIGTHGTELGTPEAINTAIQNTKKQQQQQESLQKLQ